MSIIISIMTITHIRGNSERVFNTFNTGSIFETSFTFIVTFSTNVSFVGILTIRAGTLWWVDSSVGTNFTVINGIYTS
jgi:hypothetical protein